MNKDKNILIQLNPKEGLLKRKIRRHLASLGFTKANGGALLAPGFTKEVIRAVHAPQRKLILENSSTFLSKSLPVLQKYFASGADVDASKIAPRLERVISGTWQSDLFRLASLSWSVPVSSGFGRRLRFLIWDEQNGKLIGLLAIGDPVFNLAVRDKFIGWSGADRAERLVNVLDSYVLGAIPPYNMLLGGKLVACMVRSREIYDEFAATYGQSVGIISQQSKCPQLLAVTTSSSMGRSSLYNRLKVNGTVYFKSLGFTGGWGHFHVPDNLFVEMRDYLRQKGHEYADLHAFGQGPNWRIRTIRAALAELGFKGDLLKHGIQREVFVSLLADNSLELLRGETGLTKLDSLQSAKAIGEMAVNRWMIQRACSHNEYKQWSPLFMEGLIKTGLTHKTVEPVSIAV